MPASNLTLEDLKNNYFKNVSNIQSFLENLKNNGFNSKIASFVLKLEVFLKSKSALDSSPSLIQLNTFLEESKQLPEYKGLSNAEKITTDEILANMKKSFVFWQGYDTSTEASRRCR